MRFTDCINITGESCKEFDGKKIYISTGAVNVDYIDLNQIEAVNYDTKPSRANLITDDESILFAKMQGTKKVLLIDQELEKNLYSTGFFSVSPKKNILNKKCLYHLLGSQTFLSQKDKYCSGATQKAITLEGLNKIEITIPKLEEQNQIAKILDSIKTLIESYEKELRKYDDLIKARFIEMFGDSNTNNMDWNQIPLLDACDQLKRYPTFCNMEYLQNGTRVIRIGNILSDGNMDVDDRNYVFVYDGANNDFQDTVIELQDIIMAVRGDGSAAKRIGIIKEKKLIGANISPNLIKIRAKKEIVEPIWLFYYLTSEDGQKRLDAYVNKTAKKNIAAKDIAKVITPVPTLSIQKKFVSFVQQVDKSKLAVQQSLEKTQQLFDSLMQEYFG